MAITCSNIAPFMSVTKTELRVRRDKNEILINTLKV